MMHFCLSLEQIPEMCIKKIAVCDVIGKRQITETTRFKNRNSVTSSTHISALKLSGGQTHEIWVTMNEQIIIVHQKKL